MMNLFENSTMISNKFEKNDDNFLGWFGSRFFPYFTFPINLIFGIPFNILSCLTIFNSSLWNTTFFRYMAFVSLADFFVLIAYLSRGLAQLLSNHINENIFTILYCKIYIYIFTAFSLISALCLLAVTFDRYVCIAFPTRAKSLSTLGNCNRIVFIISSLSIITNIYCLIVQNHSTKFGFYRFECTPKNSAGIFFFKYWLLIFFIIYAIIPVILFGILNILMIKLLKKYRTERIIINIGEKNRKLKNTTKRLTIISICISTSFILLNLPIAFMQQYIRHASKNYFTNVYEKIAFEITFSLNDLNHVINFIFYCICGKTFREELFKLLKFKHF